MVRYPAPLRPGDRIGVTAPSSGVPAALRPRLDFAISHLSGAGYDVVVGAAIAAVVPPWGGELAVDLLVHLDLAVIGAADPTWLVGYSDISTLMLPLTLLTGTASVHAENLMDTPYRVPAPLASWLDVATAAPGATITQRATTRHRSSGFDDWARNPSTTERSFDAHGSWSLLDPAAGPVRARGRLVGGCLETISVLAGTPYGDVPTFAAHHAPEGLVVYVEVAEHAALDVARDLWRLRLAGWFEAATAVLVGRTSARNSSGLTQCQAVASVLSDLDLPVVLDVDLGHVPPQLALVNGALADITVDAETQVLAQHLR